DRPHGCNKQNKLFLERFNMKNMMLHANELRFSHPMTKKEVKIKSAPKNEFSRMLKELGFKILIQK
ncbi:MAG: pseudouridylate synthase, partial [Crocinitomicaceae bacterium]|nr:pseudouridylate synthase [Crocinitomicaceae bacterium]